MPSSTPEASRLPVIALVVGDPAGISPELTARIMDDLAARATARLVVVGDARIIEAGARVAGISMDAPVWRPGEAFPDQDQSAIIIDLQHLDPALVRRGKATAEGGRFSLTNLRTALRLAREGVVGGIVYTPFNKYAASLAMADYEDDVSIMAEELRVPQPGVEFNILDGFWNARVTSHIPLSEVASGIKRSTVLDALRRTDAAMRAAGFGKPRIAVAGLNPHAGESGKLGREEIDEIAPAVAEAKSLGIDCAGPFPPDTVFLTAKRDGYDAVQTMYHDQGQIAMKLMGFERGVTLMSGFPVPIITPAHGTAYDIAGQGKANPGASLQAISVAAAIARTPAFTPKDLLGRLNAALGKCLVVGRKVRELKRSRRICPVDECRICKNLETARLSHEFVCQNAEWVVKHEPKPYPVVGWFILYARRHAANAAFFDATQQAGFGKVVTELSKAIMDATGCLRVYLASMSEGVPHFHMHFVPRYADGPKRWDAFHDIEKAKLGGVTVSDKDVADVIARLRQRLPSLPEA